MSIQEIEAKLQELNLRKNDCLKKQDYKEAAKIRDIERSITSILADSLFKEAEIKLIALNRERYMLYLIEDKEYVPLFIEDTEEYKKLLEKYAFTIRIAKEELR
jgi:hypothetical protein